MALLALGDEYMGYSEATVTELVAKGLLVEVAR